MLRTIIEGSRLYAGWDVPWFVAQVSYHSPTDRSDPEIRAAQQDIWKSRLALEGPDTDQLGLEYRENNGAGVHFSAKGLEAHGRLWANKVGDYIAEYMAR